MTPAMACSQPGCGALAVRALVNSFGYVFLECGGHARWSSSDPVLRVPAGCLLAVLRSGTVPDGLPEGSETVEVPLSTVVALQVMEG